MPATMHQAKPSNGVPLSSVENMEKQFGHFKNFLVNNDALLDELDRASKDQIDIHQVMSSPSGTSLANGFLDLFEAEFARVTEYIKTHQEIQEFAAKALLTHAEVLLANPEYTNSSRATASLRLKVQDQVDACLRLQRFRRAQRQRPDVHGFSRGLDPRPLMQSTVEAQVGSGSLERWGCFCHSGCAQ